MNPIDPDLIQIQQAMNDSLNAQCETLMFRPVKRMTALERILLWWNRLLMRIGDALDPKIFG